MGSDNPIIAYYSASYSKMEVPTHDPNGAEIPKWKREMMAKKAAEKGKKEAIQKRAKEDEDRKMAAMPVWKKQLIEKKMDDPKRQSRPSVSSDSSEQSSNAELSLSPSPPTTTTVQDHQFQEFDPSWRGILRKTESKINLNE